MKKYIVTEQQLEDYKNNSKIQYAPEKIDEFVADAHKCAAYLKKMYDQYYQQVLVLSVGDIMDNPEPINQILGKMDKEKEYVDKLLNKYFNTIEMYSEEGFPDNVKQLDKLYTIIDHLQYDIDAVKDIFQAVYDSVEHFREWNQEKK